VPPSRQSERSAPAEEGSREWNRAVGAMVQDALVRLAATDVEDFTDEIRDIFRCMGTLLGVLAMGEITDDDVGERWVDDKRISEEDVEAGAAVMRLLEGVTGPTSARLPDGRVGVISPCVPGSFARATGVICVDGQGLGNDGARALELLASVVASARSRNRAEVELRARVAQSELLGSLSERAATDVADEQTLEAMLELARDRLHLTAASTLVRDGDQLLLVATTDYLGTTPVATGTRLDLDFAELLELTRAGHFVRGLTTFEPSPAALLRTAGEVLCVPRYSPEGLVGVVVFTDVDGREWSPVEIDTARSVARSIQTLTLRTDMERKDRSRRELDRLVSDVAAIAASASIDVLDEIVTEALRLVVDVFGIRAAGIWAVQGNSIVRLLARWADGRASRDPVTIEMDDEALRAFAERSHGFISLDDVEAVGHVDESERTALVVPIGSAPAGAIVLVDPGRWWNEDEIATTRALANLAEQARARLLAETAVRSRLRSEEFISTVAALAVEIVPENSGARLGEILRLVVEHFGVAEASIWRLESDAFHCRSAVRGDGSRVERAEPLPARDLDLLRSRGWSLMRVEDVELDTLERTDPGESRVLLTAYGGPEELLGVLVMIDPVRRWWDDESIATARAVADLLGQVRLRMQVARRLDRQLEVDKMLARASSRFVHSTLDDAEEVVTSELEALRGQLGFAALTLLDLDHRAMELRCPCEVTDDGVRLFRDLFPMGHDQPMATRLVDRRGPTEWAFADLVAAPVAGDRQCLVSPARQGRDVFILIASRRDGSGFEPDAVAAVEAMTALLAQLRQRLVLETKARRRALADQLVGSIAESFVEQPPYDHERAVEAALARIGEFFELRAISRWDIRPDGSVHRSYGWRHADFDHEGIDRVVSFAADDPVIELLRSLSNGTPVEIGRMAPAVELTGATVVAHRLARDGAVAGGIVALSAKPKDQVVDLDIQQEVLESVARLIEQLWRRADADRAVARQLRHEDQLRRFATRLVTLDADATAEVESAFRELLASVSVDFATIWFLRPTGDGFEGEVVLRVAGEEFGSLPPESRTFRLPRGTADRDRAPHFSAPATTWSREEAPTTLRRAIDAVAPPGPRRIAFLPAPTTDPAGIRNFLTLSRSGNDEFRPDELEFFRSAHSLLVQHQARVTAEKWFGAAFRSAPIGISLREADMTLIHCNRAYCDLVGRSVADLLGTSLFEVVRPDLAEVYTGLFDDGYDGMKQFESCFVRPDGSIRWASVRTTPVYLPGHKEPLLLTYAEDITEGRRNREMLEYQATHDELTGLPNRRSLVAEVTDELERSGACAVLVLDLDRFKVVNDSLGHSVGDQLLVTCADRIRLSLRPGDSVCRLGGDEFAILLRSPADTHAAGVVADRLLTLLREPVTVGDDEVFPSASIGVALSRDGDTVEDLLRHADAAMYQAKGHGRDRWEAFDGSMRQAVVDRVRTETDLRRAVEKGQLEVHYQPEFLLEAGKIVGVEALVRWHHPERGLLTAGSFIGLAEEAGLVVDLGRWVLGQASVQAARWVSEGHDIVTRVNLSARQLRGAIVSEVEEALAASGLRADRLCLELTETAIMNDVAESTRILSRFRDLGVQVAIDDFGTGFSSLAYLKRFPVDILKIDRTFVDGVGSDADDTAIVRSVIGLARTLRLDVVAEGIENETQVEELIRLGCRRGQGFFLARPAPVGEVSLQLDAAPAVSPDSSDD
jgi:diguanylate cyclase (GGDEF)-like protein/PAS domain S-box-containing protein